MDLDLDCHHLRAPYDEVSNDRALDRFFADSILNRDFDIDELPTTEGPTKVNVSMHINDLSLCSKHQELTFGGYFRQFWRDPRLALESTDDKHRLTLRFRDMFKDRKVWVPDTFIIGDRHGFLNKGEASGSTSGMKVMACGKVTSSMRMYSKIPCAVAKDADEVTCAIAVESCQILDYYVHCLMTLEHCFSF